MDMDAQTIGLAVGGLVLAAFVAKTLCSGKGDVVITLQLHPDQVAWLTAKGGKYCDGESKAVRCMIDYLRAEGDEDVKAALGEKAKYSSGLTSFVLDNLHPGQKEFLTANGVDCDGSKAGDDAPHTFPASFDTIPLALFKTPTHVNTPTTDFCFVCNAGAFKGGAFPGRLGHSARG